MTYNDAPSEKVKIVPSLDAGFDWACLEFRTRGILAHPLHMPDC